jgi:hypothetical protein
MSSTIDVLKQLIQLEEKRAGLTQELASLENQLASLTRGLMGGRTENGAVAVAAKRGRPAKAAPAAKAAKPAKAAPAPAKPASSPAAPARKAKGGRAQRGALAENIVSALKSAGAKGMTVKDIADEVGSNYRNVAVWFVTTGKKNKSIKKIAPATYRLA